MKEAVDVEPWSLYQFKQVVTVGPAGYDRQVDIIPVYPASGNGVKDWVPVDSAYRRNTSSQVITVGP